MARQKNLPYASSNSNAKYVFGLIHVDIWGHFSTTSIHGFKYFFTILDDHSRYLWMILIKNKAEVSNCVKGFVNMAKT